MKKSFFVLLILYGELAYAVAANVSSSADALTNPAPAGSLRAAIDAVNAGGAVSNSITFDAGLATITLAGPLPPIQLTNASDTLTITGDNTMGTTAVSGNNTYPGFFINQGTVTLSTMVLQDMLSKGGDGGTNTTSGNRASGGGGGLGAGGAFFVGGTGSLTIDSTVTLNTIAATGGNGGATDSSVLPAGGSGGGGFHGTGGGGRNGAGGGGGFNGNSALCSRGGTGGGGMFGNGGSTGLDLLGGTGGGGRFPGDNGGVGNGANPATGGVGGGVGGGAGGVGNGGNGGIGASGAGGGGGASSDGTVNAGSGGSGGFAGGGGGGGTVDGGTGRTMGSGGAGQTFGGGGGAGAVGGGAANTIPGQGGDGGDYGGGGGGCFGPTATSQPGHGGIGGFGGGGGGGGSTPNVGIITGFGGAGGFGAGGGGGGLTGSSSTAGGSAGRGGGDGGSGTTTVIGSGGGGAALGGVAFVRSGGTLMINTDIPVGTLTAGISGAQNGSGTSRSGQAVGTSIFINGNTTLTFSKTGGTQTVLGTIVDDQSLTQGTGTQGSGSLAKSGNGTLVLSGINTYTGGTTATAGIISIGADSGIGSLSGGLTLNGGTLELTASFATTRSITLGASGGTFQVDPTFLYTVNSSIGGAGNFTKTGTGVLLLGTTNAYGGSTNVGVGTLRMGAVNALPTTSATTVTGTLDLQTFDTAIGPLAGAGSVTGTGAILTVNESAPSTFSGVIGSSLSLIKSGASTLTLSGANTYSGTTTISAGTLQIGASNTLPSLTALTINGTLDMNNNTNTVGQLLGSGTMSLTTTGALTVSGGAASLFSGNITSSGGTLTNTGGGTLTLTGNNIATFNGQLINNFPSILNGNNLSISNSVLNDGTFIFNQTVDGSYAGLINTTASGAMSKQGAASLDFTGTLAQNTVSIDGGEFRVNTLNFTMLGVGGLLTVQAGGILGGTGVITGNVTNFGTVNPGNSIGTLTIHGDYLQATGSSLIIGLSPPTQADRLVVTGAVIIQNGATLALQPDFGTYPSEFIIEIVTAGSVTGTFSTVTTTLPSFSARVVYFPAEIDLILNVIPINVLQPTGNPNAVANCLEANASYADFTNIIDQLHFMSLTQMRSTLEEMQPSLFKGLILTQQQNTLDLMSTLAIRHTPETGCGGGSGYRYSFWATPYFSYLSQAKEDLEPSFYSLCGSAVAGADFYAWSAPLVTSVAFAYTGSNVHWNQNAGSGSLANYYGALSVSGLANAYFYNASFVGGWSEYQGKRNVFFAPFDPTDFPTSSRTARHCNHGYELAGHLDGGALFTDLYTLRPILGVDYIYAQESGFTEQGAGSIDLQVDSASYDLIRGQIGFSVFRCFDFSRLGKEYFFQPEIGLYFMQEWRFHGEVYQARFVNLDCEMTVKGTYPNRSLFVPSAKLSLFSSEIPANRFSLFYQAEIGNGYIAGKALIEGSFGF